MEKFSEYAKREILGQEKAIELIESAIERFGRLRIFDGVAGMVTLAGTPACGKNFAAKVIGRYLQREMKI